MCIDMGIGMCIDMCIDRVHARSAFWDWTDLADERAPEGIRADKVASLAVEVPARNLRFVLFDLRGVCLCVRFCVHALWFAKVVDRCFFGNVYSRKVV